MVSLMNLWLPILLSAVLVFVMSTLIHMVFKWHNSDYHGLSNEADVSAAIRKGNPAPGQYMIPYCADMKEMGSEAMQQKFKEGPIALIYLRPAGPPSMGASLGQWFVFNLVVGLFVAYIASRTLVAQTDYLHVFRVVSTVGFLTYVGGDVPAAIWMGKPWKAVAKDALDGLIYGLLMGGAFGWLWPR